MGGACYKFGPFQFDPQTRLLYRADERIALTPKAADLLLVLLQHERQLLGKEELIRLVWPDTFVENGNLSKHIFFLRKTLGKNGEGTAYIETVPKRGYRFVGRVEQSSPPMYASIVYEERTSEQVTLEEPITQPRSHRWLLFTAAITRIACAGAFVPRAHLPAFVAMPQAILVLPLANLSGIPSDDYFSDGLTEEFITALTGIRELRVVPRGTAFQFKGSDVREAGRRLEVDAVLEGGVRRRDSDQMRVSLRLVRVADGTTFWSQSFTEPTTATIAAQQEVARAVLAGINPHRSSPLPDRVPGTQNLEAYNTFLRGRFAHQEQSDGALTHALALYREAVRLDPGQPFGSNPLQVVSVPIAVTMNGTPAEVMYAGGYPGTTDTYQINFRVPSGLMAGTGNVIVSSAWIPSAAQRRSRSGRHAMKRRIEITRERWTRWRVQSTAGPPCSRCGSILELLPLPEAAHAAGGHRGAARPRHPDGTSCRPGRGGEIVRLCRLRPRPARKQQAPVTTSKENSHE
jgi:DNA-binding winged helix-turn-helix (wHTH) protein/TolB-like protein